NPFNPATTIYYSIKKEGRVLLTVHNLLGEQVSVLINEVKPKGKYRVVFNAGQLANGIYFYKLCVNDYVAIDKMTLIK
ncbi:MAG: T9SS type A sorting domain-containing protein, partial [Ignavibacteriae bacterium]|nr:T9SS type A sorting domain-containing protein [Ignavibacteriota bacterium]